MIQPFLKKKQPIILLLLPGVFFTPDEDSPANLILLDAFKERLEFPELT